MHADDNRPPCTTHSDTTSVAGEQYRELVGSQTTPSSDPIANALATLGVSRVATWEEIRRTYRLLVREAHPDRALDSGPATARTASLNSALDVLAAATDHGRRPLPPASRPASISTDDTYGAAVDQAVVLRMPPGDIFVQLLDAAYELGDVNYMDPEAGLIQLILDGPAPAPALLLIAVDTDTEPPSASFTLDSPDQQTAPPIREIVDRLATVLRRPLTASASPTTISADDVRDGPPPPEPEMPEDTHR